MLKDTRIGLPLIGSKYWYAGVTIVDSIILSVIQIPKEERPKLFLVITEENLPYLASYDLLPLHAHLIPLTDGLIFVGANLSAAQMLIPYPFAHYTSIDDLFKNIDILLPINSDVYPGKPCIPWIPDFQHHYLPQLFSAEDIQNRNVKFKKIADNSPMIIFTSNDVKKDFSQLYPSSTAKAKVLPIPVHPKEEWFTGDAYQTQLKYNLPDKFILCSNQFWMHKNHATLFKAIAILRQSGHDVHLVCTGSTFDYRNPDYFTLLQKYINELNIADLLHILGLIPRQEQIQLMRRCLFAVHPSLFEGLNLIAQECQLLGKKIILSDLPIHQEQNFGTYFSRADAVDLAKKISDLLPVSSPGPNRLQEIEAQVAYTNKIKDFNRQLSELVEDAQRTFAPPVPAPTPLTPAPTTQITIATTIGVTKDLEIQKRAVNSWIQCGFKVVAINTQNEMDIVKQHFPAVEFVTATRDAKTQFGKPYIYLDDILAYFAAQPGKICGIVNSDIYVSKETLPSFVHAQAINSLVFGSRVDVTSFDNVSNGSFYNGFDYFFFDKDIIKIYPPSNFCLGLPWWDYWMPLIAIISKIPAKRVVSPICFHLVHPTNYSIAIYNELAIQMSDQLHLNTQPNAIYIGNLQNIILDQIVKLSNTIEFTTN
jgi:glycosyltransferase involved in cell wall biosynthesis